MNKNIVPVPQGVIAADPDISNLPFSKLFPRWAALEKEAMKKGLEFKFIKYEDSNYRGYVNS